MKTKNSPIPVAPETKPPTAEREKTDESLRTERTNTDQAIAAKLATAQEGTADAVVERAREEADAVLDSARDKADLKLEGNPAPGKTDRKGVAVERALEDATIEREREAADEKVSLHREQQAQKIAELLPHERAKTDKYLLTERARADDMVAHRDDFLGMVSHDLRSMLNGILLYAEQISQAASDTEEGHRAIAGADGIRRYVGRMTNLIGDLVDVVGLDAGKLEIHPSRSDAAELLREAAEALTNAAKAKQISMACDTGRPGALMANFDEARMLQVLTNLLTNAIKFTPKGGRIWLVGKRRGNELHVTVTDTGVGIPESMLESVFERYWQRGKTDKRGLGLGLYISKSIVTAHGGKIWAESEVGTGSTFHVTIPFSVA